MGYNRLTTDKPTLITAGSVAEYEKYCSDNGLDETNSLYITSPQGLDHYPKDCPLVKTGTYWLKAVSQSQEWLEREKYFEDLEEESKVRSQNEATS